MSFKMALFLLLIFTNLGFTQTQDSSLVRSDLQAGAITAEVQVDSKEVPQNQTVRFSVKVSWQGDLDRYEIEKLETPILKNLEVVHSASSNWVGEVNGVKKAIKTYDFTLKPQALGMAYIDALIIEYRDNEYGEQHSLVTNRLEVKIVDPVLKKDNTVWFVAAAIVLSLAVVSVGAIGLMKKRKAKEAELRARELAKIPIEVDYLREIKEKVDTKNADIVESFSTLSKLFRRYLSERYHVPALEFTSQEIGNELHKMGISEQIVEQTNEVLQTCDVAKFSGGDIELEALQRGYTLVEDILNRNKNEFAKDSTTKS